VRERISPNSVRGAFLLAPGNEAIMNRRGKEPVRVGDRSSPRLIAGAIIGIAISSLAAGAMLVGAGIALVQTLAPPD
jgi:hypothetical protein